MTALFEVPSPYAPPEERRCSRCGEVRSIDEFPIKLKATGLRKVWCHDCCRAYGREHYVRKRPVYLAKAHQSRDTARRRVRSATTAYLKAHPCVDCGETDVIVLDFDHRDRSLKRGIVSRVAHDGSLSRLAREIEKCDVRCGNCHRIRTAAQLNWRKGATAWRSQARVAASAYAPTRSSDSGRPVVDQLSIWSIGLTKRCFKCRQDRRLHEFAFADRRTGEKQAHCRRCHAAYRRDHYLKNRAKYIAWAERQVHDKYSKRVGLVHEYLRKHPCVDCGETNITVLEFDHVDGSTKTMEISSMIGRRSWTAVLEEIGKCDVRCVNCHRRRTARQQAWPARLGERRGRYRPISTIVSARE